MTTPSPRPWDDVPVHVAPRGLELLPASLEGLRAVGDPFRLHHGRARWLVLARPEHLREALGRGATGFAKLGAASGGGGLGTVLGRGLLTETDPDAWARRRAIVAALLRRDREGSWAAAHDRATGRMLARVLDPEGEGGPGGAGPRDLWDELLALGREALLELAFSLPPDALPAGTLDAPLALAAAKAKDARVARERLDRALYALIDARSGRAAERGDWLDELRGARDPAGAALSREELRDELATLLSAGHETSAAAAGWTLRLLAERPDVQARLRAELGALPDGADPTRAPYLGACVDEALRLRPPIPHAPRVARSGARVAGIRVPNGERVLPSLALMHRHPALWSDPDGYRPERHLEGAAPAFAPFGYGARHCVGRSLASFAARRVVAATVRAARLEPDGPAPVRLAVGLVPKAGLRVRLRPL